MTKHYLKFTGRKKNAIGVFYKIKTIVEIDNKDIIQELLYTTFDHISSLCELTEEQFNNDKAEFVRHKFDSKNHYLNVVHYLPSEETNNVACINGSAHLKTSIDLNQATCQKCLDNIKGGLTWFKNCNYKIR